MKASHFIYSEAQRIIILDFEPNKPVNYVFSNDEWVPYTEINSTGNSNFEDAQHLGIHPRWWVKQCGVIQDSDLIDFINQGDSK
tara:strand:- start:2173 stop:2424 length:252 start_codon:yes stop_codon:yes gene_type:complete